MKKARHPLSSLSRRSLLGAGAGTLALSLLGCGGDDIIAGMGSGGTGSYSSGAIRGYGSILVGDIHYDESAAQVFDDAGASVDPANLRLGMIVDVNGGPITPGASGRRRAAAHVIAMRTEIEGPVASVDLTNGTLTVLDQEVRLTRATVLDGAPGGDLTALRGRVVTVSGFLQASGHYIATRLEVRDGQPERYTLRGISSEVDTAARTLRMGGALISWADADLPAQTLANGQYVRVELDTDAQASGAWRALSIGITQPMGAATPGDGAEVELEGCVNSVSRADQTFIVLGITVDYSQARFEDGNAGNLAPGVKVEVEGRMSADGQVLIADEVEFDDDDDDEFEIEGRISSVSPADRHFVVRGVTVDYSRARFDEGSESGLAPGVRVKVEGRLADDGATLIASEIEFDDDDEAEISGTISSVSRADRSFVVRGVTVDYSQARFDGGSESDLAPGVRVEVEGRMSADGQTLVASEIEFDD